MTHCLENLAPLADCCQKREICIPSEPRERSVDPDVLKLQDDAYKVILTAFQLYKPEEFMFTFNGGKDCTVVLYLLLKFYRKNIALRNIKMPVVYIQQNPSFDELDQFVNRSEELFGIDVIKKDGNMREVMSEFCKENPQIKAVFMGCRSADPHCDTLKAMQLTDVGWPELMRVNPLMSWTYTDVWKYIRAFNVPYCNLYDLGYTSLGNKDNTIPNPTLKRVDPKTCKFTKYEPAYMLTDDSLERLGRL